MEGRTLSGNGQFVLLAVEDLLLVLSEEGDIALVKAAPDRFTGLRKCQRSMARPGITRCWSAILLVRNGEEMAAFRLASYATPAP